LACTVFSKGASMIGADDLTIGELKPLRLEETTTAIASLWQRSGLYVFLIAFTCLYYLSNAETILGHYDLGWHLAAGDLIRQLGHVPFQDPWSFTLGNSQWFNLSWLWDVIASIVVQYTGFAGIVLLTVASGAAIVGYLIAVCLGVGASSVAVCIAVFTACILYPSFPTAPNSYLSASPNTVTMLFCVVFYKECLGKARWLLYSAMMVIWTNLHGGFPLGFLILGIFLCGSILRRDWAKARNFGLAGIACFAAVFVNPLGWHIYDGVVATLGHFVQIYITKWWSYFGNVVIPGSIPGMVYIVAFVTLDIRYRKSGDVPLEARVLTWLFLGLGLYQFRYMGFFFLFSVVPLSLHIDRLLPKRHDEAAVRQSLFLAGLAGLCALPLLFMRVEAAFALPDMLSEKDVRFLQQNLPNARVLNHWNVGGLLIFRARGSVPVFVDGRAATAYPDDLLRDYFTLVNKKVDERAWDHVLETYKIDAVLWVRAHEELRQFLVQKRGWNERYTGEYESIYAKPDAN
jgi:hypothetical protein